MAGHDHDDPGDLAERMDRLDDPSQYRYLSAEELRAFLDPGSGWTIADLGSGTGLFTNELAPVVDIIYAVDIRAEMHARYRANGVPANVVPVQADVAAIPLADDMLDGAVSLRSFHHDIADNLAEVARVLMPGGRFVVVDWSETGAGDRERARDPEKYFDLATVQSRLLDAGFRIRQASERRETFVVVAALRPN